MADTTRSTQQASSSSVAPPSLDFASASKEVCKEFCSLVQISLPDGDDEAATKLFSPEFINLEFKSKGDQGIQEAWTQYSAAKALSRVTADPSIKKNFEEHMSRFAKKRDLHYSDFEKKLRSAAPIWKTNATSVGAFLHQDIGPIFGLPTKEVDNLGAYLRGEQLSETAKDSLYEACEKSMLKTRDIPQSEIDEHSYTEENIATGRQLFYKQEIKKSRFTPDDPRILDRWAKRLDRGVQSLLSKAPSADTGTSQSVATQT